MKKDNKIIDDLARLAGSTFAGAVNLKNDLSEYITNQVEKLIKSMDFIRRDEFEAIKKIAQENRSMLEKLQKPKAPTNPKASKKTKK
jgi:BMFP domain-containing protein YqiC